MNYVTEKFFSRMTRSSAVKKALRREKETKQEEIAEKIEMYKKRLAMTHGKKTMVKLKSMIKRAEQRYKKLDKIR